MKKITVVLFCLVVSLVLAGTAFADGVIVTTGAGYKTMVEELCKEFRASGGAIEEMYGGHIGQMLMQIKQGSDVNIVISDKGSLDEMSQGVEFDAYESLGDTLLVLAWRKGLDLKSPKDLEKAEVKSVCHPDTQSAIYGRAAGKFLESSGIGKNIEGKLSVVSSVPQVFAYLSSGEMDAGFLNRVMILNGGDKLGGWIEISEGYPSLNMVAAVVKGNGADPQVVKFLEFLRGEKGREILKKNGIW
jgi:molybdate transport system substrate-binding protein